MLLRVKHGFGDRGYFSCWLVFVGVVAATSSCGRRVEPERTHAIVTATDALTTAVVPSASSVTAAHLPEESCGVDHSGTVRDTVERVTRDPKSGRRITAVGERLDRGATRTTVGALLKEPTQFVGKSVFVEGNVTAMCSHRRAWFAVVDETTQVPLRIITAPNFRVPVDAMNKRAFATGVIERHEVSEQSASHLSQAHGLPAARQVITLRATGAEFF